MKTTWTKHASVTRPGRFFYRKGNCTVLRLWLSDLWIFSVDGRESTTFATSAQAKRAAEKHLTVREPVSAPTVPAWDGLPDDADNPLCMALPYRLPDGEELPPIDTAEDLTDDRPL